MHVGSMDRHFVYDAENRQVSFTINNNPSNYSYDGNGLRVSKTSGGNTTCYAILDHLGAHGC